MEKHVQLLSNRERKIIELMAEGCSDASIGSKTNLSEVAVRQYINKMLRKQGFDNPYQLITWAYREAII